MNPPRVVIGKPSCLRGAGRTLKYKGYCLPYILFSTWFDHGKAQRYVDGEKRRPSKMQARIGLEDDITGATN